MEVFVINLRESADRRECIAKQLEPLDLDHCFFDALDGPSGIRLFECCDEAAFFANTGRSPTAGEIGCYSSHLSLWQLCATLGKPITVLEDDAHLSTLFGSSVETASKLIDQCGFIRFQSDCGRTKFEQTLLGRFGPFEVGRYLKYPYGALAYAISPRVARIFVANSRILAQPVDQFIKKFWDHGCPLYGFSPATVEGGPLIHNTTIAGRRKVGIGFRERRARMAQKARDAFKRTAFNLRFRHRDDIEAVRNPGGLRPEAHR